MNDRHTITINGNAFLKLRNIGRFGESYSDIILRLIDAGPKMDAEEGLPMKGVLKQIE
jgi:predicted CopG family antitoxin